MYPSFPFFLYTNPRWLTYLLEPILEYTLSGQYPNKHALHDIGAHFPNATGHPDGRDEYMPVEERGNILIMGLALINSLRYDNGVHSGSIWSSLGEDDADPNPRASAFSLRNLEERDNVWGLDDRWGGLSKGNKQAQKWVQQSYRLWKQWTGYLVEYSLRPFNQRRSYMLILLARLLTQVSLHGRFCRALTAPDRPGTLGYHWYQRNE